MSVILLYSPFNHRSRDTESLMIAFLRQGHKVISLSQVKGGPIHEFLKDQGIETHSFVATNPVSWLRHLEQIMFLVRFCSRHKIQIVYSHLEPANFIASVAQFFTSAKVFICRHHSDQYHLLHRDQDWSYKLTYALARHIIVFSEISRRYMVHHEKIFAEKIKKINLAYDFSLYPIPQPETVTQIKKALSTDIILIAAGNLNPLKRPETAVYLLKSLLDKGYDAKLILLGSGELDQFIKSLIEKLNLTNKIEMPGYVDSVLDYMAAATFLVHPSISESSCVVVKEAGLVNTPVIVGKGVGDFDDYIVDGVNGFLVDPDQFVEEATGVIERSMANKGQLQVMGKNLNISIHKLFSVDSVISEYNALNSTR